MNGYRNWAVPPFADSAFDRSRVLSVASGGHTSDIRTAI
jgi:hypothetical protein